MEVELLSDDDFDCLEAACQAAENQQHQPPQQQHPPVRRLPASFAPCPPPAPLPYLIYRGRTSYSWETAACESMAAAILALQPLAVGFDIEWRVLYQTGQTPCPVALMQLCVQDQGAGFHCHLMHIIHAGIPPALEQLLRSTSVAKVGVGIGGDAIKLARDYNGLELGGVVDLSEETNLRLCGGGGGVQPKKWSLVALTERFLSGTLRKDQNLRCSDWERAPLSHTQQLYAATDAWVSLLLFQKLDAMPVTWQPPPPLQLPSRPLTLPALSVPACAELAPLQPAKRSVYDMHAAGATAQDIAAQRGIQAATVLSYLAEAISAGYAYDWGRFAIPQALIDLTARLAAKALALPAPLIKEIPGPETVQRARDLLSDVLEAKGGGIRELVEEMQAAAVADSDAEFGFGEVRLAFAHLGRCNP